MELMTVRIEKPEATNFIRGQTHFVKSGEGQWLQRPLVSSGAA